MKKTILIITLILFEVFIKMNAATITAGASGNWSAPTTWDSGTIPSYQDSVVVPTGITVTIDAANYTCRGLYVAGTVSQTNTFYVGNINIASGGIFNASTGNSSAKTLYWGVLNTGTTSSVSASHLTGSIKLTIDGRFGGTAAGTNDGIAVNYGELATSYTIDGASTTTNYISRLIPYGNADQTSPTDFNFNIRQNLTISNSGLALSLQNNKKFAGTRTMTIFPGYTVSLLTANSKFHCAEASPSADQGNITYNIYGTLDLNAGNTTYFSIWTSSYSGNTQTVTVNVGNGTDYGILKLGRNLNLKKYYSGQTITMNWDNPKSRIVFGGGGNVTPGCQVYNSGWVDDARVFPERIRNLSFENTGSAAVVYLPRKVAVTDTLYAYGYNNAKLSAGFIADGTAKTVNLGRLFYLNNNAYVVTAVSSPLTTVTSTTLGNAGTWSKGATLTDAYENQYYCDSVGMYAGTLQFVGSTSGVELTGGPIQVTGDAASTITSGFTARFSASAYIGGNMSNGAGTLYLALPSVIGNTLSNAGTISLNRDLSVGSLINNGSLSVNSNMLTLSAGSISGSTALTTTTNSLLHFSGKSVQTLSDGNISTSLKEIRIAAGSKLTTSGNIQVTTLTLNSSAQGTATLINNGTLTTSSTNFNQYLPFARNWYISSPVNGSNLPVSGFTLFSYDEAGTHSSDAAGPYWYTPTGTFTQGAGYIAQPSAAGSTLVFTGSLSTGNTDVSLSCSGTEKTGFNLIGNPYPCHLTWTKTFAETNAGLIQPTIWLRTNAGTSNNSGQWSFVTYNGLSEETVPASVTNGGIIAPAQAFWVKAKQAGTLTFNSDLTKSHQISNPLKANSSFTSERKKLRLEISDGTHFDETLIFFDAKASDSFDDYDSPKLSNDITSIPELSSLADNQRLAINGLNAALPDMQISLGFSTGHSGEFTIRATQIENFDTDCKIYLSDKTTGTLRELTLDEHYTFSSDISDTNSRFSVIYRSSLSTGVNNTARKPLQVYTDNNNRLVITGNPAGQRATVNIYNSTGQLIRCFDMNSIQNADEKALHPGTYIVRVRSDKYTQTEKLIVRSF